MTLQHRSLWDRIQAFDMDGQPKPVLRFVDRLAKENSWSTEFATRAVREDKRFVFLSMTAGRSMCPSEQVDQVWHLHLTYTRSYWQRFCNQVIGSPLHHDPTRGGSDEGRKHWAMYSDTLLAYREAFGEDPPCDLWPPPDQRFGDDLEVAKVNRSRYWLVRKPRVPRRREVAIATAIAAIFAAGCAGNPFELKGASFLPVFFAAWAVAFAVGLLVRWVYRGPSLNPEDPAPKLHTYEIAYLLGGRTRVLAAAMVRLKDHGNVDVDTDGRVIIRSLPAGGDQIDREVFDVLARQSGNTLDPKSLVQAIKDLEDAR